MTAVDEGMEHQAQAEDVRVEAGSRIDEAAESGTQPFDPFAEPTRSYWRGAAVFSCEAFGVPVAPGCLMKAIANLDKIPAVKFRSASSLLSYLVGR